MVLKVSYPSLKDPLHPLSDSRGYVKEHRAVLYEKIGPGHHKCNWCRCDLEWMPGLGIKLGAIMADHVDGDPSNNTPANLVPSCHSCNVHRQKKRGRIKSGELVVYTSSGKPYRAVEVLCLYCHMAFLSKFNHAGVPYKSYCSHRCSARATVKSSGPRKPGPRVLWNHKMVPAVERNCLQCGRVYLKAICTLRTKQKFCSMECAASHQRAATDRVARVCVECGAEFLVTKNDLKFHPHRLCSKRCANKNKTTRGDSRKITTVCLCCRNPFTHPPGPQRKFCSLSCWGRFYGEKKKVKSFAV